MADSEFTFGLGGVIFRDFEIPESVKGGGAQAITLHKYPGGARTGDTTGPDDDPIKWSGYFEDSDAVARCRQIDGMRRQGLPVSLQWSGFSFLVLVSKFTWDFRKFFHIPYEIELEVIQDYAQPLPQAPVDVEAQIQSDNSAAASGAAGMTANSTANPLTAAPSYSLADSAAGTTVPVDNPSAPPVAVSDSATGLTYNPASAAIQNYPTGNPIALSQVGQ